MEEAILASASELVTVALKRIDLETETDAILNIYNIHIINLLLNIWARNAKNFLLLNLPRTLETNWLKLEIHIRSNTRRHQRL
jgi:thiazole synthase